MMNLTVERKLIYIGNGMVVFMPTMAIDSTSVHLWNEGIPSEHGGKEAGYIHT